MEIRTLRQEYMGYIVKAFTCLDTARQAALPGTYPRTTDGTAGGIVTVITQQGDQAAVMFAAAAGGDTSVAARLLRHLQPQANIDTASDADRQTAIQEALQQVLDDRLSQSRIFRAEFSDRRRAINENRLGD